MAGVEQNRYKTNNGCIKHLPQTGRFTTDKNYEGTFKGYCSMLGTCHVRLNSPFSSVLKIDDPPRASTPFSHFLVLYDHECFVL